MEKIFITGCAGFIGQKTTELLLEKGLKVVGVDNMNDYYDVRIKEWRLDKIKDNANFIFKGIDIENYNEVDKIFKEHKFDAVINLAARAGVRYSMENPFVYMSTNTNGTLNLLEIMKERNIKKMVLASTSSLYAGQKMPFNEELTINTPISQYAASKKAAEVLCYTYQFLYKLDITIVRYFTVYGPAGRPDMCIFRFIKWIDEGTPIELFGDGTQSRDFTYVNDIAKGTIKALKPLGYEVINLGGGKNPISINYVINKIEEYLGKKAKIDNKPFHIADIKETWADIDKADKLLGWKPEISLDEGLKKSVDWYLENKSWLKDIKL
jgi:nucleoside-diphosphate-sugar epimerase